MDRDRLAEYVVTRRTELGLSQDQLAERADVAQPTVSAIETVKGGMPRRATLAKIERALAWAPGSLRAILDGGQPEPAGQPTAAVATTDPVLEVVGELRTDWEREVHGSSLEDWLKVEMIEEARHRDRMDHLRDDWRRRHA